MFGRRVIPVGLVFLMTLLSLLAFSMTADAQLKCSGGSGLGILVLTILSFGHLKG